MGHQHRPGVPAVNEGGHEAVNCRGCTPGGQGLWVWGRFRDRRACMPAGQGLWVWERFRAAPQERKGAGRRRQEGQQACCCARPGQGEARALSPIQQQQGE